MNLIAISKTTAAEARCRILGCECCTEDAAFPLPWVLDAVTGRNGSQTDYVLPAPIHCPRCAASITEETLVEWD